MAEESGTISGIVLLDDIPKQADLYLVDLNACATVQSNSDTGEYTFSDPGDNSIIPVSDKLLVICHYGTGVRPLAHGPIAVDFQTPADAGLVILALAPGLWLDASDSATVLLSSGAVYQWSDKSGNNRHATQSSSIFQPAVVSVDGKNMLSFAGSTRKYMMTVAESVLNGTTGLSVFVVVHAASSPGNAGPLAKWNNGANAWTLETGTTSSFWVGSASASGTQIPFGITALMEGMRSSSLTMHWINGGDYSSAGVAVPQSLTAPISIGSIYGASGFFGESIAEILIFPSDLVANDRQKVEGYLAHKWGFSGSLPEGHPYKGFAPTA